jgi:hypothetical protein
VGAELGPGAAAPISDEQRDRALALIRADPEIGNVRAFRAAGAEGTIKQLRQMIERDDELQEAIAEARGRTPERIEAAIVKRAIDGVEEPVYHQGKVVGYVTKYSDRLLEMMARAHAPEYRERVEVSGAGGGPLELEASGLTAALERFNDTVDRLAARRLAEFAQPGGPVRALERGGADEPAAAAGE